MFKKKNITFVVASTLFSMSFICSGMDAVISPSSSGKVAESSKYTAATVIGSNFFTKEGKRFLNLSEADIAVQPDYILKPDDVTVIDIWGDLDLHYSLTINKDGFIVIPNAGRVDLRGLSFEQGKKKILNKLADTYGFYIDKNDPGAGKAHLDVALGKISGVKVYLTGEVIHPGVVLLNGANSSVIAAIASGEGLRDTGSVRNIQIIHADGQKSVFDLYDFLFKGKLLPENKYLKEGDTVYVPPITGKAYALGALTNPGTYEIKSDETVASLIDIAGGFNNFASKTISVSSENDDVYDNKVPKAKTRKDISKLANYKVNNGDIILAEEQLNAKPYSYIEIAGKGARYNGKLRYERGLTVEDYINRAGGLYRDAYKTATLQSVNEDGATHFSQVDLFSNGRTQLSPGDVLIIEDSETVYNDSFAFICGYVENPKRLRLTGTERISDLVTIGKPRANASLESSVLVHNSFFVHNGSKISLDLEKITTNPESVMNVVAQKHDILYLSKYEPYIEVTGAVLCPGLYPYSKHQTAEYYINLAGGFCDNADKYNTIITEIGGGTVKGYYKSWGFFSPDPVVKNSSKITVPEIKKM